MWDKESGSLAKKLRDVPKGGGGGGGALTLVLLLYVYITYVTHYDFLPF